MHVRRLFTILTALVLLAAAAPAGAQQPEAYRAESDAAGVELTVLDNDPIRVADTASTIDTAPLASARGLGLSLSDASRSQAEVSSSGGDQSTGENCLVPDLPAPLGDALRVDQVCSQASAELVGLPSASGRAELAGAAVDGEALATLLADVALEPIAGETTAAFDQIQEAVLSPVYGALAEACTLLPGGEELTTLTVEELAGALEPLPLPEDDPCTVLLDLLTDPPVIDDGTFVEDLTAALEAAIADLDGVALVVASGTAGDATEQTVEAVADYTTVTVQLPSLAALSTVLDGVTEAVLRPFVDELDSRLAGVSDTVGDLPGPTELVTQFRDLLDLAILTDTAPLARLEVLGASASASFDRASGDVMTSGSTGLVEITLSPALADLFGVERTQTVEAGQSITLLEGTPLESTIAVGDVQTTQVEHDGVPGERVEARSAEVTLLTGAPGGGVDVAVGTVSAAAFGQVGTAAAPAPSPPLPATGAGAPLAALAVLAAGTLMRRR